MSVVKFFHVLFVFIWIGGLLSLTRLMGYHCKEEDQVQRRLALLYKRMYFFVQMPSMILAVVCGLILWATTDLSYHPGWFHMKLTFASVLIVCDVISGFWVMQLQKEPDHSKGVRYKILHGITGLALMGVLFSSLVVRNKPEEIRYKIEKETIGQKKSHSL